MIISKIKARPFVCMLVICALTLGSVGCSATRSASVKRSGFLGNLSELQEVAVDDEQRVFVSRPNVLAGYNRFILEPVLIYFHDASRVEAVNAEDLVELTNALREEVARELAEGGYDVVDSPGPGVLRVQAAITDVDAVRPSANVAAKAAGALTLGGAFFVPAVDIGRAAIEVEMRDAMTGERVVAFLDARKGRRFGGTIASVKKWAHAKDAFKVWAKRFRSQLDAAHKR